MSRRALGEGAAASLEEEPTGVDLAAPRGRRERTWDGPDVRPRGAAVAGPMGAIAERLMASFPTFVASLAAFFLLLGVVAPNFALTFLRALVVLLALAYVGARVHGAGLPARLASDAYSPFDRTDPGRPPPEAPAVIRGLASQLEPADEPALRGVVPVPKAALRIVVAEATRRLAEHHGLDVEDPAAHDRIRALVSDATWAAIRPVPVRRLGEPMRDPVLLELLDEILDDVERL